MQIGEKLLRLERTVVPSLSWTAWPW